MDLRHQVFELTANDDGHASAATRMVFDGSDKPFRATYAGPNVHFGHAIVEHGEMLYHARDVSGQLSAGQASVTVEGATMTLHWRWLTGDAASGVSVWRRVDAASSA